MSDTLRVDARSIAGLASAAAGLLRRFVPDLLPDCRPTDLEAWDEYLGAGYGHHTAEGDRAVQVLGEVEGLTLEPVYTGKTAAAFLDAARSGRWRGRPILYWHTCDPVSTAVLAEPA